MAKEFKVGVIYTGDASGAVKATKLTEEQLEMLNQTQRKSAKQTKATASEWDKVVKKAAGWAAGLYSVSQAYQFLTGKISEAREIQNLAQMANTSTQKFQEWAAGVKTVGFEQDKLADILKDTSDRVGDFLSTGGGPMKDFFENIAPQVGVTAEQFRNLSGPDALQLYVSSLEKANLSQNEMAFYMEAVASDATRLLPLLQNNGKGMAEMASRANELGAVMDDKMLVTLGAVNSNLDTMKLATKGAGNTLLAELLPSISKTSDIMVDYSTNTNLVAGAGKALDVILKGLVSTVVVVGSYFEAAGKRIGAVAAMAVTVATGEFSQAKFIFDEMNKDTVDVAKDAAERLKNLWSDSKNDLQSLYIPEDMLTRKAAVFGATGKDIQASLKAQEDGLKAAEKAVADYLAAEDKRATATHNLITLNEDNLDLLNRELVAIKAGEAATNAFNREKAVELAMRDKDVSLLQPQQIELYKELAAKIYDAQTALDKEKEAHKAAEKAAADHKKTMQSFVTEVVGAFVDGANSISGVMKDLWQRLKREFINSGVAALFNFQQPNAPILSGLGALFSGGGGGSGGLSAISGLGSLFSGGGALAGINSMLLQGGGYLGSALGNMGFGGVANTWAGSMSGLSSMPGGMSGGLAISALAGVAGNYVGNELGSALFGKQAESAWGATAGGLIGTVLGGPIGAGIGALIGGMADSLLGGDGYKRQATGVHVEGVWAGQDTTGYSVTGSSGLRFHGGVAGKGDEAIANQFADALALTDTALTSLYRLLGTDVDLTGVALQGSQSDNGKWGQHFFGSKDGSSLTEAMDLFVDAWAAKVEEVTGTAIDLTAFKEMAVEGEALADTVIRIGGNFELVNDMLTSLGRNAYDTSIAGMAAATSLVEVFGGLENFANAHKTYYDKFYSEEEKLASLRNQVAGVIGNLNAQMPETHEQFRALVESFDITTQEGREAYAQLIGVAGAFDLITSAAQAAGDATEDAAASLQELKDNLTAATDTVTAVFEGVLTAIDRERNKVIDDRDTDIAGYQKEIDDKKQYLQQLRSDIDSALSSYEKGAQNEITKIQEASRVRLAAIDRERNAVVAAHNAVVSNLTQAMDPIKARIASFSDANNLAKAAFDKLNPVTGTGQDRQQALAVISNATAGSLPASDMLGRALDVVANVDKSNYSNQVDYLRDLAASKNAVSGLVTSTSGQLSTDEKALAALEKQVTDANTRHETTLKKYDDQIAAINAGTAASIKAIEDNIEVARKQVESIGGVQSGVVTLSELTKLITTYEQEKDLVEEQIDQLEEQKLQAYESAQKQLDRLQEIADTAQKQIDVLNGVDNSVKTVTEAVAALMVVVEEAKAVAETAKEKGIESASTLEALEDIMDYWTQNGLKVVSA